MSQHAISIAEIAGVIFNITALYISSTILDISKGFLPIAKCFISSTASLLGIVCRPPVASPKPAIPSEVSTITNTQFFHGFPTTIVLMSVIFILSPSYNH